MCCFQERTGYKAVAITGTELALPCRLLAMISGSKDYLHPRYVTVMQCWPQIHSAPQSYSR